MAATELCWPLEDQPDIAEALSVNQKEMLLITVYSGGFDDGAVLSPFDDEE